jgi:hypothetical protein
MLLQLGPGRGGASRPARQAVDTPREDVRAQVLALRALGSALRAPATSAAAPAGGAAGARGRALDRAALRDRRHERLLAS